MPSDYRHWCAGEHGSWITIRFPLAFGKAWRGSVFGERRCGKSTEKQRVAEFGLKSAQLVQLGLYTLGNDDSLDCILECIRKLERKNFMFISQLRIANFRQLRNVEIGPFREPTGLGDLIVLAGPNGSGKSSILELLSFGIANRYSWQYYQSRNITEHSFAVRIGLTQSELDEMEEIDTDDAILSYAKTNRGYWMVVNMPDAISPEEYRINEQVHGLVSRKFQNFTRKLGFFLRVTTHPVLVSV